MDSRFSMLPVNLAIGSMSTRAHQAARILWTSLIPLPTVMILALGSHAQSPLKVQLLFPVENGTEFEKVTTLSPQAKLITSQGKTYILVADFTDARVAYRLGKSLQRRLKLPFELSYDPGHPQADFVWLRELAGKPNPSKTAQHGTTPTTRSSKAAPNPASSTARTNTRSSSSPLSLHAADLGLPTSPHARPLKPQNLPPVASRPAVISATRLAADSPPASSFDSLILAKVRLGSSDSSDSTAAAASFPSLQLAERPVSAPSQAETPSILGTGVTPSKVAIQTQITPSQPQVLSPPTDTKPLPSTLTHQSPNAAATLPAENDKPAPEGWLNVADHVQASTAAIAFHQTQAAKISVPSEFRTVCQAICSNPNLIYVIAVIHDTRELDAIKELTPGNVVRDSSQEGWLAQMGIYQQTPKGRFLLDELVSRLRSSGFTVLVVKDGFATQS